MGEAWLHPSSNGERKHTRGAAGGSVILVKPKVVIIL